MEPCEARVRRYLKGVREALEGLEGELGPRYRGLLDAARRYADDAAYYLERGDCETALAAVSYAEGLIDSLKYLGVAEARWESPAGEEVERRVLVAGTFDILHPGHLHLFREAARHGRVYVVVARDSNVEKMKGKRPILPEDVRLELVSAVRYVYKAMLGDPEDMLAPVGRVRPHVILLGPDQPFDPERLAGEVEKRFGFRPRVERLEGKRVFAGGLRSSSDIVRRICLSPLCREILNQDSRGGGGTP
ncbi:DUF357 domain-containing protein [Stetteria hydrogenophila]